MQLKIEELIGIRKKDMATAELVEVGLIDIRLGDSVEVGNGPKGTRLVVDVPEVSLKSDRVNATLATNDCADWLTLSEDGQLGSLDVRLTLKTDDGAYIYVEYGGRSNMASGLIATAPTFQTGHEKYKWLNSVQAVAAGQVNLEEGHLVYRLYEVKVTAEEGLV